MVVHVVLYQEVDLQKIKTEGRKYFWPKIVCPKCNIFCWGHGYVLRNFSEILFPIFIKRWRCRICRRVFVICPTSHWRRYQERKENIFNALLHRLEYLKWPPWGNRQRGGHWLRKFLHNCSTFLLLQNDDLYQTVLFYKEKNLAIF